MVETLGMFELQRLKDEFVNKKMILDLRSGHSAERSYWQ